MNTPQLVTAFALNLAERHDAALRAQGLRTADDGGLWRCYDDNDAPFLAAIATERDLDATDAATIARGLVAQREGPVFICDSFNIWPVGQQCCQTFFENFFRLFTTTTITCIIATSHNFTSNWKHFQPSFSRILIKKMFIFIF